MSAANVAAGRNPPHTWGRTLTAACWRYVCLLLRIYKHIAMCRKVFLPKYLQAWFRIDPTVFSSQAGRNHWGLVIKVNNSGRAGVRGMKQRWPAAIIAGRRRRRGSGGSKTLPATAQTFIDGDELQHRGFLCLGVLIL